MSAAVVRLFGRLRLILAERFRGELQCGLERFVGRHLYVGLDTRAFPIGLRNRVDGARKRHSDREMLVDRFGIRWVRAAQCRLSAAENVCFDVSTKTGLPTNFLPGTYGSVHSSRVAFSARLKMSSRCVR